MKTYQYQLGINPNTTPGAWYCDGCSLVRLANEHKHTVKHLGTLCTVCFESAPRNRHQPGYDGRNPVASYFRTDKKGAIKRAFGVDASKRAKASAKGWQKDASATASKPVEQHASQPASKPMTNARMKMQRCY